MKSLKLTIKFKSGNAIAYIVNYVHVEDDRLFYTVKHQVHDAIQEIPYVNLAVVDSFDIEESDLQWNHQLKNRIVKADAKEVIE